MNRKQKKELREHQSTRQLMGIGQITERGVKTAKGELVFFLVRPDNLSVLSPEGVQGRVSALADLLRATPNLRMLALDSRESFQANKLYYQRRLEEETVPAIRDLLRQDMAHLDEIQSSTASAREFALVYSLEKDAPADPRQLEKRLRDRGFHVRMAEAQDMKRLLAVYYQQDLVGTSSISLAPPQRAAAGLAHSAAPPLPHKAKGRLCGGPSYEHFPDFDGEEATANG